MESSDSSPNYTRATSSFNAKKEDSPQGSSECDEIISVNSSTCGSAINGPHTPKQNNIRIKYRTNNKKTTKNFVSIRSFHRRAAKSRILQSPVTLSDEDSLIDSSEASPHYLKATSSSKGKKTHPESHFDGSDKNTSHSSQTKSSRTLSRTSSSLRNVRILIKKTSFKPKRSSLAYSKVSEDVSLDRATYSSTLKDSKFPKPVELHTGGAESEKVSAVKVCRYHHCSLHGHCHENHEPVPPLKQFVYKRRRSLKKRRSFIPKADSRPGEKNSSGKKKNHPQKSQMLPTVEPLNLEGTEKESDTYAETYPELEARVFGDGYDDIQESGLFEVAFGETSFPERSYQDSVNILRKYSSHEQEYGGTFFGLKDSCLRCSCNKREQEIANSGSVNEASDKDCPETPVKVDEVTKKKSVFSSASHSQTSSNNNSDEEGELITESTLVGGSNVNEAIQVKDSDINSPTQEGSKLQFIKPRHISMWNLIHQHMSTNLPAKPTDESFEGGDSPIDGADSLPANESTASNRDVSDSDEGKVNNDSENQEIEIRKLFAIKLVREAIEKILLPEIQDQASDDQSITSENTPRPEPIEENQSEACTEENQAESDADKGEGSVIITGDASGSEIEETEKNDVRKSEKKAPKHWSNLKKWILLQRFIRALEKVRRFNPGKPQLLPLNPDPEAEKVNLRPQTVDGRKNSEEWMLDYALRQAVNQLAPTQKKKVALLVKAFETVVPSQEEPLVQFRIPKLKDKEPESNGNIKPEDPDSKNSEPSSTTQSLILDGSGISVASENNILGVTEIMADEREGLQEDSVLSDCIEGKKIENDKSIQMDRKNHIKMWHMIYQHVVSGIAEKIGSQLLDGVEDDEVENAYPASDGGDRSDDSALLTDESTGKDHISGNLRSGLTKSDALKLVKEAVDEILLPEIQDDSSDTQSVTSESMSEQDMSERNFTVIEGQDISSQDIVSTNEEPKAESKDSKKTELLKSKNWSKLKKLILLKRSIRALEKARKLKPQPYQLFPQLPDPEPEKIDLRSQMTDERKKAEQWMLDYAVQHIVTKLTPARKRRVSMLVEAFEAVVPLPEI